MYGNVETALDKPWGAGEVSALEAALEAEKAKEPPPPSGSGSSPLLPEPLGRSPLSPAPLPVSPAPLPVSPAPLPLSPAVSPRCPCVPAVSGSFLLYNERHSGCVVSSGRALSLSPCSPSSLSQRFQWLPGGRLRHLGSGLCAGAARPLRLALVLLGPCRERSGLQRWECGPGALLALAGTALRFNFGHEAQRRVMLHEGDGDWSRWLAHGTAQDVCSRACLLPCSKGWVFFRNSCYFFSKSAASWENSQFFCSALGAQLLEIDDAEEKRHIQAQLRGPSWLGIRDRDREGTWTRGDGTALDPNNSWWHRDEPNGGALENCAAVGQDGLWADYPCGTALAWVCEGPP